MTINYIPNDPHANNPPMVAINPHADRPSNRARFNFFNQSTEGQFDPGTDEFLYWQCREAALCATDVWEIIDGNIRTWVNGRPTLNLIQKVAGENTLNAFYNRRSLSFFEFSTGGQTFHSGASTDVVAHEAGHAFLDQIRPDLFSSSFVEPGAFHEAFGDCIAILTALEDQQTRQILLAGRGSLRRKNFVESTAEDLSAGIKSVRSNHNAAEPRHALNNFKWVVPGTLPVNGGPGALINEIHSFGMVFSGCFYDTISNIFRNGANQSEAGLQQAARTAGRLLAAGARSATLSSRFFRAVGNAMILADRDQNGGANEKSVMDAFSRHDIKLDTAAMLAPTNILAGRAPRAAAAFTSDVLTRASRRDLVAEIGQAEGQRFFARPKKIAGDEMFIARHRHQVPLDDVSERLEGVVALVDEEVLLGESGGHAAVFGAVPTVNSSMAEVQSFVHSLVENGQIAFNNGDGSEVDIATHSIRKSDTRRVLTRSRFSCGCGRPHGQEIG